MNRYIVRFRYFISIFLLVLFGIHVNTESVFADSIGAESIRSFDTTIRVNDDSSIDVDEILVYNTGPVEHHGIFRDIRMLSSTGGKMKISNIRVVNENGLPYNFVYSANGDSIRVKIGDAHVTFLGQKTYHLSYRVSNAVSQLSKVDEIYWNVTGNDWKFPIDTATAKVILPTGVTKVQSSCYLGVSGSKEVCLVGNNDVSDVEVFSSGRVLQPSEGITVAVGFPKGIVTPYKESFSETYGNVVGPIVFVLTVFCVMFTYWFRNWRDPKGKGIIVPQYDVPEGLTPMEVDAIVNERIGPSSISAEIIYLATKGYIKIRQIETKIIMFFKSTDYEIICLKFDKDGLNEWDKKLLYAIFTTLDKNSSDYLGVTNLSVLEEKFYLRIPSITDSTGKSLLIKKYYKNIGKINSSFSLARFFFQMVFIFMFFVPFLVAMFLSYNIDISLFIIPGTLSVIIFGLFWNLSPAKTEKGVELKEYLLGLKEYLQIAEKDRLAFHNAPEKKPEVFEKLLPYAMVLGVDKVWAKEFEGIYVNQPSWYEGATGAHFTAVGFNESLSNFNSAAITSLASTPSNSGGGGSGGGGSSGGGGGGGGGGSW